MLNSLICFTNAIMIIVNKFTKFATKIMSIIAMKPNKGKSNGKNRDNETVITHKNATNTLTHLHQVNQNLITILLAAPMLMHIIISKSI